MIARTFKFQSQCLVLLCGCFFWVGCGSRISTENGEHAQRRKAVPSVLTSESLEIDPGIVDLGVVDVGGEVPFEFEIKNRSDSDVVLDRIIPGCGCTTVTDYTSALGPGEATTISGRLAPPRTAGRITKHISIRTNKGEVLQVSITASVRGSGLLGSAPESLALGKVNSTDWVRRLVIGRLDAAPMKDFKMSTTSDKIVCTMTKDRQGAASVVVEVRPVKNLTGVVPLSETIHVSEEGDNHGLDIMVTGTIHVPIPDLVSRVMVRGLNDSDYCSAKIIESNSTILEKNELLEVRLDGPDSNAIELACDEAAGICKFRLHPGHTKRLFSGNIIVALKNGEQGHIPFIGVAATDK